MSNTENEKKEERISEKGSKRKPLTRKQRIIVIVVASVFAAMIIAGAVTAAVLLTKEEPTVPTETPSRRMQYSYYIGNTDTEGYYLDDSFRADVPLESLERKEVLVSDDIVLEQDLRLHVTADASVKSIAQYVYLYKDKEIAVINIAVATIDSKINTVDELMALKGNGTYALACDMDLSDLSDGINSFNGTLYGNHHKIKGLKLAKGLFTELNNAKVIGLDFTDVDVEASVTLGSYGVLAGTIRNTEIGYCSARGSYSIEVPAAKTDIVYVGGLIGYASANDRKDEAFGNEKKIYQCVSYLDLTVSATGDVKVGGLVGGVVNATVRESYAYGKLKVTCASAENLSGLYIGGIAGVIDKKYSLVNTFNSLDEGSRLYCYSDIEAELTGNNAGITIYAGGICGLISNHSIANAIYGGKLNVRTEKVSSCIGGIAGCAENATAMAMKLRGVAVNGNISVYSLHNVYAGGLAGKFIGNVDYQANGSVKPTIETDSSVNTGLHIANEAVARTE